MTTVSPFSGHSHYGQPQGQFGQPQGQFGQPQGEFGQPQGQFGQPQGQLGLPQGQFGQPQGQFGQPQRQFGQPQGQYGQPRGQFGQPHGQFGQPHGQHGKSRGQHGKRGVYGEPPGVHVIDPTNDSTNPPTLCPYCRSGQVMNHATTRGKYFVVICLIPALIIGFCCPVEVLYDCGLTERKCTECNVKIPT